MKSVGVFVYGDIGRSPRMQNHALELSKDHQVYFMGYFDTAPRTAVLENPNIRIVDLQIHNLQFFRKISFYLYAMIRVILQILQIFYYLGYKYRNLEFVLVQNPPAIPNLMAIWLASFIGRYRIIIDFHNYGFTILNLAIKNRIVISIATWYERFFARKAHSFLCVSDQMKEDLKKNWKIEAITLYDRPAKELRPSITIKKDIFLKKYNQPKIEPDQLLLVSSTSWTKDEDFSILLDALELYDQNPKATKTVRTFITGKGPEKEKYLQLIEEKKTKWTKISVTALWLESDDYPVLLSICDLGVCLHYSSSGLDLPMKVVDMFSAGIPVLAIDFPALPELVKHQKNGLVFDSREQLQEQLLQLSSNEKRLLELKEGVKKQSTHTWDKEWQSKFPKLISS